jgi:hypothetical protein
MALTPEERFASTAGWFGGRRPIGSLSIVRQVEWSLG